MLRHFTFMAVLTLQAAVNLRGRQGWVAAAQVVVDRQSIHEIADGLPTELSTPFGA
jgi:hypothetical protein